MIAGGATLSANETAVQVLGWGAAVIGEKGPARLAGMDAEYLTQDGLAANAKYSAFSTIPIAAGMIGGIGSAKDTGAAADYCTGDAGGPMLNKLTKELVGIVSFGSDCNTNGVPGVYTNVPFYYDWLSTHVDGISDLNGAATDVNLGDPVAEKDLCKSNKGKMIGIAVGVSVGAVLLIALIVVCYTKQGDGHFFKGVVRRMSKVFHHDMPAAVAPANGEEPQLEQGGAEGGGAAAEVPEEVPAVAPPPAHPSVNGVESKGLCSKCGKPVLVTHEREKNDDGTYCHAKICPP